MPVGSLNHRISKDTIMRTLILTALLAVGFAGSAFSADEHAAAPAAKAENANCCCGKPADAKIAPVTVTVEGKTHTIGVCSDECAKAAKADPKKALAGVEAHNKKDEPVKAK